MASLDETGDIVASSLNVVNNSSDQGNHDNNQGDQGVKRVDQQEQNRGDLERIFQKLQSIDTKLNKIDEIERRLLTIENSISKIGHLETRMKKTECDISEMKRAVTELEKSGRETDSCLDGLSNLFDELKTDVLHMKSRKVEVDTTQFTESLSEINTEVETVREELREEILDLKCRSMRDNLLFIGLPEAEDEDCERMLTTFVRNKMKVRKSIGFERVHRIGRKRDTDDQRVRPVVAKFSNFKDRELVRKQAPQTLKGSDVWVQEQFPPEIEQRRKALYPVMSAERKKKKKVSLVRDTLYIDGVKYVPPEVNNISDAAGSERRATPSRQDRKRPRVASQ